MMIGIVLGQSVGDVVDKGVEVASSSIQTTGLLGGLVVLFVAAAIVLERWMLKPRRDEAKVERAEDRSLREKELTAAVEAAKSIQGATQAAQAASANAHETTKVAARMAEQLTATYERLESHQIQQRG